MNSLLTLKILNDGLFSKKKKKQEKKVAYYWNPVQGEYLMLLNSTMEEKRTAATALAGGTAGTCTEAM